MTADQLQKRRQGSEEFTAWLEAPNTLFKIAGDLYRVSLTESAGAGYVLRPLDPDSMDSPVWHVIKDEYLPLVELISRDHYEVITDLMPGERVQRRFVTAKSAG